MTSIEYVGSITEILNGIGDVFLANLNKIIFSCIAVVVGFSLYKLITREVRRLQEKQRIEEHIAHTLRRLIQWTIGLIVLTAVSIQFGVTIGSFAGLLTLFGGTIIGFAAINTIGNAIAGFIIMISRPLRVGDRINFKDEFADVEDIDLMYTKLRTLDNVLVSVPNQELLKTEIENYSRKKRVRRTCVITAGFEHDSNNVRKVLLEAAEKTSDVLKKPEPFVRITNFQNYAVEYALYVFISNVKKLRQIDANLYENVLATCKQHEIDISTALLLKQIQE
jgi:small-conductance mechanosensitive channel